MPGAGTSLTGLPVAQLKELANVQTDSPIAFTDWVAKTSKVHQSAVAADSNGQLEEAFVGYWQAAAMFGDLLKHRDFLVSKNHPAYKNLKERVIPSIPRAKALGEIIDQRAPSPSTTVHSASPSTASTAFPSVKSRIRSLEQSGLQNLGPLPGTSSSPQADTTPYVGGVTVPLLPEIGSSLPQRPLPAVPSKLPPLASTTYPDPGLITPTPRASQTSFAASAAELDATVRSGSAPPELRPNAHPRPGPSALSQPSSETLGDEDHKWEEQLRSLRSPSEFASHYPTLEDMEQAGSPELHLPDVPKAVPTARQPSDLPPPPAAFDRREGYELDNDTTLGANQSNQTASGPLDQPPPYPDFDNSAYPEPDLQSVRPTSLHRSPAVRNSLSLAGNRPLPQKPSGPVPSSSARAQAPAASNPRGPEPTLPYGNSVTPQVLIDYFRAAVSANVETKVLFLDVRNREDFEVCRVKCRDIVCLEPLVIRPQSTAKDLQDALVLSPEHERKLFAERSAFQYVIVYDDRSTSFPAAPPYGNGAGEEPVQKLWTLNQAIHMQEFSKPLPRPPLLLVGGLEAWIKAKGPVVGKGKRPPGGVGGEPPQEASGLGELQKPGGSGGGAWQPLGEIPYTAPPTATRASLDRLPPQRQASTDTELKRLRRQAAVVDGTIPQQHIARSVADLTYSPTSPPGGQGYFSHTPPSKYPSGYQNSHGVLTPPIAMPQQSLQRSGPATPLYDSRPDGRSYAQPQPMIGGAHVPPNFIGSPHRPPQAGYIPFTAPHRPIDYPQISSRPPLNGHPHQPHHQHQLASPQPPPPAAAVGAGYSRPPYLAPTRPQSSFNNLSLIGSPYSPYGPAGMGKGMEGGINMGFGNEAIGLTGLKNLGNTCYMNSTLQCMSATVPLARFFKDGSYKRQINRLNPLGTRGQLAESVAELIRVLWGAQYTFVSPITFREAICRFKGEFRGSDQHDAQEFLAFFLDGLHEDLNRVHQKPKPLEMTPQREAELERMPLEVASKQEWDLYKRRDNSIIVDLFQGQYRSRLQCLTCKTTSTTYSTFMYLSLEIPTGRGLSKVTLQQCIEAFLKEETLEKDNAWNCPRCRTQRKATKALSLTRLPPVLLIHLKRFSFKGPFSDKVETLVQYPTHGLDLTKYMPAESSLYQKPSADYGGSNAPRGYAYDLYAVCNHFGSLSSGHYTAFVRSRNDWYNVGDSRVSRTDDNTVKSARSAYLLCFHRREF